MGPVSFRLNYNSPTVHYHRAAKFDELNRYQTLYDVDIPGEEEEDWEVEDIAYYREFPKSNSVFFARTFIRSSGGKQLDLQVRVDKMDEGQLTRLVTGVPVDAGGAPTSAAVR